MVASALSRMCARRGVALLAAAVACGFVAADDVLAQPLTFTTEDGRPVSATVFDASIESPPALVMVCDGDDALDAWDAFAREAADHGVAVVSIRLPADSAGSDSDRLDAHAREIRSAVRYVREREDIDGVRVALLAVNRAANAAAHYATDDQLLVGLGLLSPSATFGDVPCVDAVTAYGARPLLVGAGRSPDAQAAVALIETAAQGNVRLVDADGPTDGPALLGQFRVRASILEWLDGVFQEL